MIAVSKAVIGMTSRATPETLGGRLPEVSVLSDQPYDTPESLMDDLNSWGRSHGLGFSKTNTSNPVDGKPTRVDIACNRGGWLRPSKSLARKSTTSKTDCKWSGVAKALKPNGRKWTFEVLTSGHNHQAIPGDAAELITTESIAA